MDVFKKSNSPDPVRVRMFPVKPGARSAAGLVEFEGVSEASEAMVMANHTTIPNPCKYIIYIVIIDRWYSYNFYVRIGLLYIHKR